MNNIEAMYYIRDGIACIGVLVGLAGAVFLFVRKKVFPGVLALLGFILLGIEPLLDVILWRILGRGSSPNWNTLNTTYACVSGPSIFLGIVMLVAGLLVLTRAEKLPPPQETPADLPPMP